MRDGELTVHALTDRAVELYRPSPSILCVLKQARLVVTVEGRETHYSARPQGLAPLLAWMSLHGAFWRDRLDRLETLLNRMDQ